ncbi:MAG: zf-HC2 domain-containing protein [Candidatus Krumholzibacteria bacterium]|nr:zf-HC2 domain-containing protein [Candidatus Krumholzibacteria bacterium]
MNADDKKTSCSWVVESIDSYIDGDLGRDEMAAIKTHVNKCRRCREELAFVKGTLAQLRDLPNLDCPRRVSDVVHERLAASRPDQHPVRATVPSGFVKRWFSGRQLGVPRPALASALIVLVVLSSLIISRINRPAEHISPEQVSEAEAAVKWTFAYVNEISRRSGLAVRDEVFEAGVIRPMQRAVRSALEADTPTVPKDNGGSI